MLIMFFCATGANVAQGAETIYIVRRDWHIDVGFAAADLEPALRPIAAQFPGVRYLFFGFGDRRYLLAKHRNATVLLEALWPGPGMLLVTALVSSPEEVFGDAHVVALPAARIQVRDMQRFIRAAVAGNTSAAVDNESLKPYGRGPYDGSLYFSALARYSGAHTCNTWAAEALKAGHVPVHSGGVVFAGQLWSQVRRLEPIAHAGVRACPTPCASPYSIRRQRVLYLRRPGRRVAFRHGAALHGSSGVQGQGRGLESFGAFRIADVGTNSRRLVRGRSPAKPERNCPARSRAQRDQHQ